MSSSSHLLVQVFVRRVGLVAKEGLEKYMRSLVDYGTETAIVGHHVLAKDVAVPFLSDLRIVLVGKVFPFLWVEGWGRVVRVSEAYLKRLHLPLG